MSSSAFTPRRRTMQAWLASSSGGKKNCRQDDDGEDKRHHDHEVGEDILVDFVGFQPQRCADHAGNKGR